LSTQRQNVVFVGNKPLMNYVLACLALFHDGNNEVQILARGRTISRAVDVAQMVISRFLKDVYVKSTQIGSERITTDEGRTLNKSTITITLSRRQREG